MGGFYDSIREQEEKFIKKQKMFFISTAPLSAEGHINLSPKGTDSFRVLSPNKVAYMDLVGSGNETSAHMQENGRVCFMFCSFVGPPNILRLYGKGYTVLPTDAEWETLAPLFEITISTRQIIVADIYKVQNSCGYSVPLYAHVGERDIAEKWAETKGEEGIKQYIQKKNKMSLDGLETRF
jgi:hypothetical protein